MPLYRIRHEYRDGRIWLRKGRIVEFDQAEADRLNRDSESLLEELDAEEVQRVERELSELGERTGVAITPNWAPETDNSDSSRGRGPGAGTMHTGNMPGMTRPR